MEEDIHIASPARMKVMYLIKSQTAMICYDKVREIQDLPVVQLYEISRIDKCFLIHQPGLQIINTVLTMIKDRSLPLLKTILINLLKFTNMFYRRKCRQFVITM